MMINNDNDDNGKYDYDNDNNDNNDNNKNGKDNEGPSTIHHTAPGLMPAISSMVWLAMSSSERPTR